MEVIMSGIIIAVLQPQQGVSQRTQKPWVSQEYVLCHEQGQYPRSVCFRVFGQDKIQQMAIRQGEYLTVHLNIDAKQSTNKPGQFFNSIDCWKVERQTQQMGMPMQDQMPVAQPFQQQATFPAQPAPAPFPQQPGYATQQPMQGQAPFPPPQPAPQAQVQQPAQSQLPFPLPAQ